MKLSCLFPSENQKGDAHVKSAGIVCTERKRQCSSFNENVKCAERQLFFAIDFANMIEFLSG